MRHRFLSIRITPSPPNRPPHLPNWLALEQSSALRELQIGIKRVFDPDNLLNPGKAI